MVGVVVHRCEEATNKETPVQEVQGQKERGGHEGGLKKRAVSCWPIPPPVRSQYLILPPRQAVVEFSASPSARSVSLFVLVYNKPRKRRPALLICPLFFSCAQGLFVGSPWAKGGAASVRRPRPGPTPRPLGSPSPHFSPRLFPREGHETVCLCHTHRHTPPPPFSLGRARQGLCAVPCGPPCPCPRPSPCPLPPCADASLSPWCRRGKTDARGGEAAHALFALLPQ